MTRIDRDVEYFNEWAKKINNDEVKPYKFKDGEVFEIKGILYLVHGMNNNVVALKISNNSMMESIKSFEYFSTVLSLLDKKYFTLYTKKGRWDWIKYKYPNNWADTSTNEDLNNGRETLIIKSKFIIKDLSLFFKDGKLYIE